MNVSTRTLDLDGWHAHVEESGSGSPTLFVHGGFPSLLTVLRRQEASSWTWSWEWDFAREHQFIWFDRRGCYRSSTPAEGYDLQSQAADIEHLLDLLHLEAVHLIGSSAGGPISIVFAATRPRRTLSLTLVGAALELFRDDDPATQQIVAYEQQIQRRGPSALIGCRPTKALASFDALWEPAEHAQRGDSEVYLRAQADLDRRALAVPAETREYYYRIELKAFHAYMEADVRQHARSVQAPGMILHGDADRMLPLEHGLALARALPRMQLIVIHNGSHALAFRSEEARRKIKEFLRARDRGAEKRIGST